MRRKKMEILTKFNIGDKVRVRDKDSLVYEVYNIAAYISRDKKTIKYGIRLLSDPHIVFHFSEDALTKVCPHIHAESMRLYAEDAAEIDEPWQRWEFCVPGQMWENLYQQPQWTPSFLYRRKSDV
jgi:hypothetical protein